tara:strand:+ start:5135 stop:5404 length:270 start_codon:yes stop_codon:yes gene_type:complete
MPRNIGSKNSSYYNYVLRKYNNETKTCLEEEKYFKTQREIQTMYKISRCSIYVLMNSNDSVKSKKFKNYEITKLENPIQAYERIERIIN